MGLKTAIETIRQELNDGLVPHVFKNKIAMYPKHPDFVDEDDEYPYFALIYAGERNEFVNTDIRWINPSQRLSPWEIWVAITQGEEESLSIDLLGMVKRVEAIITTVTSDRNNSFRVRCDTVEPNYDPAGRWGLAKITIVIGAYGSG